LCFILYKFDISNIIELLKKNYPAFWKEIFVFSTMRLFHSSPLKNVSHYYNSSHLSDAFPDAKVSPKSLSELLFLSERKRKNGRFHEKFCWRIRILVIDLTHIFSLSENIISATNGHNSEEDYTPQINLVLLYSLDKLQPSFFRLVQKYQRCFCYPISLKEAGVKKAVIIGDKGFFSDNNVKFLETKDLELNYILPLKRNSSLIDYSPIQLGDKKSFDGHFLFEKEWYGIMKRNKIIEG